MKPAFQSGARNASGVILGIMGISDDTPMLGEDIGFSLPQHCPMGYIKGAASRLKIAVTSRAVINIYLISQQSERTHVCGNAI